MERERPLSSIEAFSYIPYNVDNVLMALYIFFHLIFGINTMKQLNQ